MCILKGKYKLSLDYNIFISYRKYETKQKLICFGASNFAEKIVKLLENEQITINYFCDNNPQKWGTYFCGIKVISVDELSNYIDDDILITSSYVESINHKLKGMGGSNVFFLENLPFDEKLKLDTDINVNSKLNKTLILVNDHLGDNIIRINLLEKYMKYFGKDNVYFLVSNVSYNIIKFISNNIIKVDMENIENDKNYVKQLALAINRLGIKNLISTTHWNVKNSIRVLIDNIIAENKYFNNDNDGETYALVPQLNLFNKITNSKLNVNDIKPNLIPYVDEMLADKYIKFNDKYICFGMGASIMGKMLQIDKIRKLIKYCLDNKFKIILLGNGIIEEEYYKIAIKNVKSENLINLTNKLSLNETFSVIKGSSKFIGVDAGLCHAAYALNIPSVVFIGGGHFGKFMHESLMVKYVYEKMECFNCGWKCSYGDIIDETAQCIRNINLDFVYELINIK